MRRTVCVLIPAVLVTLTDQIIKSQVRSLWVPNSGMLLGLVSAWPPVVLSAIELLTGIAGLILARWMASENRVPGFGLGFSVALSLALSGALTAGIDRLLYGAGIDYINLGDWAYANLGDLATFVGLPISAIMVVFAIFSAEVSYA